ncbi:MAG: DegV family protein [Lachnospiraceae bacterium]|nr:DegV family protein [Lachnospiraceae bacterium]
MKKTAVMTDSNSGITQTEAAELGVTVLPMPFLLDGEVYYEDINLTRDDFYRRLEEGMSISTSQPEPETVIETYRKLLEDHEEVVHIPMSSGLSGSCQTAYMLAREFEGRVQVVDNQRISITQRHSVLDALTLAEAGKSALEIRTILEADKFNATIYIYMDTLYYLKKGGRITPAAAALGTILKIKPVLTIQGEKLDSFAKARTLQQGKKLMVTALKKDIDTRLGGIGGTENVRISIAYSESREIALAWQQELASEFPGCEIGIEPLSLSVACHIGPGGLGFACSANLKAM